MQKVGASLRAAGVGAVYLVQGPLVLADVLGTLGRMARAFPAARPALKQVIGRTMSQRDAALGHYTEAFARSFEAALEVPQSPRIPVRLFEWSGENHHLGRADGAVRLIDTLARLESDSPRRVLLWGHGHAGNLFALMTNLLAGDRESVERFFDAAAIYYRWPGVGCVDVPLWQRVREFLTRRERLPNDVLLDVVTFGTPVRYGWDSGGYARLLHFINHWPVEGLPEYRAPFPLDVEKVISAAEGDYLQQLGIAGTDVSPGVFAWRARLADRGLKRMLEANLRQRSLAQRLEAGAIVPDEGTTLLVDYDLPEGSITEHLAGHAVYTSKEWLLFHAEEVARRFYEADVRKAA